ncbi:MAG: hypothetical protein LBJ40_12610 [Delftia acidovorans]|jgi:hypothetical protein|nr:hypothetical protein [Delftia acidovorans]
MEIWHCKNCGNGCVVRCNYIPDLSDVKRHDLFVGIASVPTGMAGIKALIQLKKALSFAERFVPGRLDEQHRAEKLRWDLGYFLDFEVQQAEAECARIGIAASFNRLI